ncbi:MAG: hypothetical protein H7Z21_02835 [Hymenobacter sp.]|nr:hypothetical protein [Hymenobacter sp.]
MNDKDSTSPREAYGRQLAAHLCDQHFGARPTATLDGPAILRFTPIRQVNLFVVQQLLAQWTQEMAHLRSPSFDFEAEDVRAALAQFMNVLSRRIRLSRPAFEPLLARAVADTLAVAQDPAGTFEAKLLGQQPTATPAQLRDALRYLDLAKPLYQRFVDALPADAVLERAELLQRFGRHLATSHELPQPLPLLVAEFNALLPLRETDLPSASSVSAAPTASPTPEPVVPAAAPEPAQLMEAATTVSGSEPPAYPIATPTPQAKEKEEEGPAAASLYEKLKASQPAAQPLSETLRPDRPAGTLAGQAPKVETLREAISINQRFSFINELFEGENMEYHAAIQHLDTLPDAESAKRYVSQHLAGQHDWTRKDEHVSKLLKLIDRKFA